MRRAASVIVPVIALHRNGSKPLYQQVYEAYRAAILDGRLRPGQRIPSTRVLALETGISRFPVLNAYSQLLAEGYLESRVGAGTVVSHSLPDHLTKSAPAHKARTAEHSGPRPVAERCLILPSAKGFPWTRVLGAFRVGQVAFNEFPLQIWSTLVARHCRQMDAHSTHYGNHLGSQALREAIANYLKSARSVRCEAEQVLIVNGSQQALQVTTQVLFNSGDRLWIEEPCYTLARDVFALNGCQLVPVPVDAEGMDVTAGIKKCRRARAAFVSPSHQFPLGVTMSATRRLNLLDWAQNSGAWIIEDDYDSEYRYESLPIASLQGLDANARVIYVGTFSKVLFPALRLGYIVVPPDLVDRFHAMRRIDDLCPPTFYQQVLADFIDEGHFARHIRRMRVFYAQLRKALVDSLFQELGNLVEIIGDEAGMHLAVLLRDGRRDVEVAERAAALNLSLWPLSPTYLEKARQGFILGFGGVTIEEIPHAVRKFRTAMK